MFSLENLSFYYKSAEPIFDNFTWIVHPGERWAVIGPSGCGKSTLLYLLAGLVKPVEGKVRIGGQVLDRPRPATGLILQDYGLLPWATVYENVTIGLRLRNFYGPDGKHAPRENVIGTYEHEAHEWIDRLGLSAVATHYPGQISGGQRQRTAIARTLTLHPDLLLMDEPFASLDAPAREGLQKLILQIQVDRALTLVIVTHSIEEAALMGQNILVMAKPPNEVPRIIDNPQAGKIESLNTPSYFEMCDHLRGLIEEVQL